MATKPSVFRIDERADHPLKIALDVVSDHFERYLDEQRDGNRIIDPWDELEFVAERYVDHWIDMVHAVLGDTLYDWQTKHNLPHNEDEE
jgi:hypothetical protein